MEYSNSGAVVPVRGDHPRPALVRPDRPAEAQPGGGERLPLLRPGRGGPAAGHSLLPGPRGGAGPDKECLDDPSFDRLAALRNHLAALEAEWERLEQLIRSVKDTIGAEERNEIMSDEQEFEAFKQRL